MIDLILTDRLHQRISFEQSLPRFISMRKLARNEVSLARKKGIRRYFLPCLNPEETAAFLREFDNFWEKVILSAGRNPSFWRNTVSSKMQEGERSLSYLALILFTLSCSEGAKGTKLLVIYGSLEEKEIWEMWAKSHGWKIQDFSPRIPQKMRYVFQLCNNFAMFLRAAAVCCCNKLYSPTVPPRLFSPTAGRSPNLIVSLFYRSSFQGESYQDPFFGKFHQELSKNNEGCAYLSYPLERPMRTLKELISKCREVEVCVPLSLLGWGELAALLLKVFFRRIRISESQFMGCDFSRLVRWNAIRCEDNFNIVAEVFYHAVSKLCQKHHFNRMYCIFEGNSFERACIQAFRNHSSGSVIGYSQGVIYLSNLKLRLTAEESRLKPEPDTFVCTGPYSATLLEKIGSRNPQKLRPGCALREMSLRPVHQSPLKPVSHQILVALDGVLGSAAVLDWLLESSEIFMDYQVCVRPHPNVPMEKLKEQTLADFPENYRISSGSLLEDIEGSFCVLYRHTSIGMQALLSGVPAIHLAIDTPLSGDPIEELKSGKWAIHNPRELKKAVDEIRSLDAGGHAQLLKEAQGLLRNYFSIPNEKTMKDFLN